MSINNKQAVILNYSMMLNDIGMTVQEKVDFIHGFFVKEPSLNSDEDLIYIGQKFKAFLDAVIELDQAINSVGGNNQK